MTNVKKIHRKFILAIICVCGSVLFIAMIYFNYLEYSTRIKTRKLRLSLLSLETPLEIYFLDHSVYPPALTPHMTTPIAYLSSTPVDPYGATTNDDFHYYSPDGKSWLAFSIGPDGVQDIDPELDFVQNVYQPSVALDGKGYDEYTYLQYECTDKKHDEMTPGTGDSFTAHQLVVQSPYGEHPVGPFPKRSLNALIPKINQHNNEVMKLRLAICRGDFNQLKNLLAQGVNPNVRRVSVDLDNMPFGPTTLELAVAFQRPEIAEYLIQQGADVSAQCERVDIVRSSRRLDLVKIALFSNQERMACMLLKAGAPADAISLCYAAKHGQFDALQLILKQTENIDEIISPRNNTALHYAVENNQRKAAVFLLQHGANPNIVNQKGETAHDLIQQKNWKEASKKQTELIK